MSSSENQKPTLKFLTTTLIRQSSLDAPKKGIYSEQLQEIQKMFDKTKLFGLADWPALDQWRELSEDFYSDVGVDGVVYGNWSNKVEINELGEMLKGLYVDQAHNEGDPDTTWVEELMGAEKLSNKGYLVCLIREVVERPKEHLAASEKQLGMLLELMDKLGINRDDMDMDGENGDGDDGAETPAGEDAASPAPPASTPVSQDRSSGSKIWYTASGEPFKPSKDMRRRARARERLDRATDEGEKERLRRRIGWKQGETTA